MRPGTHLAILSRRQLARLVKLYADRAFVAPVDGSPWRFVDLDDILPTAPQWWPDDGLPCDVEAS